MGYLFSLLLHIMMEVADGVSIILVTPPSITPVFLLQRDKWPVTKSAGPLAYSRQLPHSIHARESPITPFAPRKRVISLTV